MRYRLAIFFIRIVLALIARIQFVGAIDQLPDGPFVVASNHLGRLDPLLVYWVLNRPDVILMVAEKYKENWFLRAFTRWLNGIFVDRFNADWSAMKQALARLKAGGVLVLAPEGTRSPTEALQAARAGTGYLASKAGVKIIPVAITGTEDRVVKDRLRHLRKVDIIVNVGEGFCLPPVPRENRDATLENYTDEIMCRIAALLPPPYRGVYADHPRTEELLKSM